MLQILEGWNFLLPCSKSVDRQGGQKNPEPLHSSKVDTVGECNFYICIASCAQIATMPEKSKRPVRFANLAHLFAKISQQGSMSDELCEIATTHGRAIEAEFVALKKIRKNKKKVQQ